MSSQTSPAPPPAWTRCRGCTVKLDKAAGDDLARGLCASCGRRPDTVRALEDARPSTRKLAPAPPSARAFTEAERSLIRAMHGYLPAAELLRILNERLQADLGAAAVPYTQEQLHRATLELDGAEGRGRDDDWTSLRRLLAQARASGLLAALTPAVLEDFAIVFSLTPGQVTHLRDVINNAQEVARS